MASYFRIAGLVRAADHARQSLTGPMRPEDRDRLRQRVGEDLRRVQDLLRARGLTLRNLPAPSQRAYQFLAGIEWDKLGASASEAGQAASSRVVWRGLGPLIEGVQDSLARDVTEEELTKIHGQISRNSRRIELTIQRQQLPPGRLSPRTRAQRGWLAFFSGMENLRGYIAARRTASRVLDEAARRSRRFPPPLKIRFGLVTGIYKIRNAVPRTTLWLPTPMVAFEENGFAALAELIFDRGGQSRQRVIELMSDGPYRDVLAEVEVLGGIVEETRGAAHDLAASFDRVNEHYFNGTMQRPRLTWNRTFTGRKFAHYDWIHDTVMVTRTVDAPDVPEFVVDFLMFHELLHKFHGLHWVNGRSYAHTPEFLRDERKFARFGEAEQVLERLAQEVR